MRRVILLALGLALLAGPGWAQSTGGSFIHYTALSSTGGGSFTAPLLAPAADNCSAIPYSFTSDTNTGLCTSAADTWNLYTAGSNRLSGNSTAVTSTVPVLLPDGSAAAKALAFSTDGTEGFWRVSNNVDCFGVETGANWVCSGNVGGLATTLIALGTSQASGVGNQDAFLSRDAAANFQLGIDAASATAQTISAADSTGAGVVGASLTLSGGSGGAGGAPGAVILGNGSTLQGVSTKALTDATATAFTRITLPQTINTNYKGGEVLYEIYCDDDTNQASQSGTVKFTCHNIAGTEACGFGTPDGVTLGDGTASLAAPTFDASSGAADTIDLRVNSDCTGIVPNTHTLHYVVLLPLAGTLTPQ